MNYQNTSERIHPDSKSLLAYIGELKNKQYQIPTFQRDVAWEEENVKKLWDSIYKFYPLGSILIWKTNMKLQNHREIGGHEITDDKIRSEYNYILDGQQRTTSLLTSLYGGKISCRPDFDPTIYIDLSIESESETDDESYKKRFLYWSEIDDNNILRNKARKQRYDNGIIVKLIDFHDNYPTIQKKLFDSSVVNKDFDHPLMNKMGEIHDMLKHYNLSFIEIKGIQVAEVCQIFERINQAGKPLNIYDIVVAKTFLPVIGEGNGFYLRDLIDDFKKAPENQSRFYKIDDLTYLQVIATIIKNNVKDNHVLNITDRFLNEITTSQILDVWEGTKKALKKTFDFFENYLHIGNENLIPFRYFYLSITAYFYNNEFPDYTMLKKYFWYYSFHRDDLLSNTTQLNKHIEYLNSSRTNELFDKFEIDKKDLRNASYSSKGRLSRAILSLLSNAQPKDWSDCEHDVIVNNFFFSTDKPNLHHVFPTNSEYVLNNKTQKIDSNSLMNIVYITQADNLQISNKNPIDYIKEFDSKEFRNILSTHILNDKLPEWAKLGELPENALELFIDERVNLIINVLKEKLKDIVFEEHDTSKTEATND